jgi:tight adherence protein B
VVNRAINRRTNAFVTRFPDALELLVRGLRSACRSPRRWASSPANCPARWAKFKLVTDRIKVGKTMEEALQDTADRLNMAEFSFFCITLAIQRETGGNLAETLANLADVLRKRAQMKLKIKAMSSESKASAYIVGALPFIVFGLIYWINPVYMGKFFIDERLIVAGWAAVLAGPGRFIMAKMVNFEI